MGQLDRQKTGIFLQQRDSKEKQTNKQLVGSVTLLSLTACGMDRHALF